MHRILPLGAAKARHPSHQRATSKLALRAGYFEDIDVSMLAIFCLRLALGLLGCLLILPSAVVNPRFYRTHFLTALGFLVLAALFLANGASLYLLATLIGAGAACFVGSILFRLEGA